MSVILTGLANDTERKAKRVLRMNIVGQALWATSHRVVFIHLFDVRVPEQHCKSGREASQRITTFEELTIPF